MGSGRAVEAEDDTVWLFPVMDVRVKSPREYARTDTLQHKADITQVPESLLTVQLIHQAAGTPNLDWHVDITNEAIYELNKEGKPVAPVDIAGVLWSPNAQRIIIAHSRPDFWDYKVGVRSAESDL